MGWTFYNSSGQQLRSGGPSQATAADMEDEGTTNANRYVSPEVAARAPSAIKVSCRINSSAAVETGSYNVTSAARDGLGDFSVTIATDFSTADQYQVFVSCNNIANFYSCDSRAVGVIGIRIESEAGTSTAADSNFFVCAIGDQ